ncbi:MAG: transporter substrate-binding domain-containing protein [Alphaproteobacteria bacterium]
MHRATHRPSIVIALMLALLPALAARAQAPAASPAAPAASPAAAPQAAPAGARAPIRAAVFVDEPFVMRAADGSYTGFAVDLWDMVVARLGRRSEPVLFTDFGAMMAAVKGGTVDIAVVDLFVTSDRAQSMEFTQPIADGGLRIMVRERRQHTLGRLFHGLWQGGHLVVLGWGLLGAIALSVPIVLILRRVDPAFTPHWHEGFAEAFYHVMSVAMTGKSSYKGASGWRSRIFAAIWLVFGVTAVAYVTSSLSSVMTTNALHQEIHGATDLSGKSVGVIAGTLGETYAAEHHLDVHAYKGLDEAVKDLVAQNIDAIVFNAPELEYYDTKHPELPITEVGSVFETLNCAFALPLGSALRRQVDIELLRLHESGEVARLRTRYVGK